MRGFIHPLEALVEQRGHLFVWLPVFLAIGIGLYFSLPVEPGPGHWGLLALAGLILAGAGWQAGPRLSPLFIALLMVVAGLLVAGARTASVAHPVLPFRYYGPIEGRVVAVDRSLSDKTRLTLDQVVLRDVRPAIHPERVRVSLHGAQGHLEPAPGMVVILTGHLAPPSGPVEPGGFDFQRRAWFQELGAVGYSRTPALLLSPAPERGWGLSVARLRQRISTGVQAALPGDAGAFAAAVTTGDRSALGQDTLEALRAANLAHLLAISGLHMGLITAFVFAALRYGLALVPGAALRLPAKKIAAGLALVVAAGYLALSGGNVATERAFIMVAVMLGAVLADRRALTLRAVALAALIVLLRRPETLIQPGFQMSFAATTALVAVFGALRDWPGWRAPKLLRPVLAVVVSSGVAGAATAPVAAVHFNQIAHYGLLANVLCVPLMGLVVMPAAVLAALLWPLGLAWLALAVMRPAILWILGVAEYVAGLDGALSYVATPGAVVLPLLALGGLWLILWRGRARFAGVAVAALALGLWSEDARPTLLISETGGLAGVMTGQGRALIKPRGEGFVAENWLENDGDGGTAQAEAATRAAFEGPKGARRLDLAGREFVFLSGRGAAEKLAEVCQPGRWVVLSAERPEGGATPGDCRLIDRRSLAQSGTLALYVEGEKLRVVGAKTAAGQRPWTLAPRP